MPRSLTKSAGEQEAMILEAAAKCIEQSSILDFTMAAVSKEAGLSMGSIYKHVQSKEDVLVALSTRAFAYERNVFKDVMNLPLSTPERLVATMLLMSDKFHHYPFGAQLKMLVSNQAVLQRASSGWIEKLRRINTEIGQVFRAAMVLACDTGELITDDNDREIMLDTISVSLWSMHVGFVQVAYQRFAFEQHKVTAKLPFPIPDNHVLLNGAQRLINSFPWKKPLENQGIKKASALLTERGYR
ncbi:TetR/AcrR family transcriptional regulator [uncultured Microbulbifer sp.]|uniref:TetR/AcrR family transcriptional regulator n=1 Tax=uncultured Microbulbifer sp. TaxID=348147 RepID=UPI002606B36C|nr:TetR/AcrR family transcriptional regulator [uncultured Microbulbifer sp.]